MKRTIKHTMPLLYRSSGLLLVLSCSIVTVLGYERLYPPVDESDVRTDVYIGLMVAFDGGVNSSSNVPGVRVALDMINSDPHMLPGYTLHYVLSDSQCNRRIATRTFLEQVLNEPTKIALIGAGCSLASEPVAELTSYFNISQFSCHTASHALSDGDLYPHYFQLLPTIADTAPVYDAISEAFNWNHIVFIVEDVNLFTVQLKQVDKMLKSRGVTHSVELFDTDEGIAEFQQSPFRNESQRIYVITSYQQHAINLLCDAYNHNIRHPTHVVITYQWYVAGWWRGDPTHGNCTIEQRQSVLNNSLAVNFIVSDLLAEIQETATGLSGTEYLQRENEARGLFGTNLFSQYCFDAVWAFAYALNRTLQSAGPDINLASLSYNNRTFLDQLLSEVNSNESHFGGVTGEVIFDSNGIRIANLLSVYQYRYQCDSNGSSMFDWFEVGRITKMEANSFSLFYVNDENITTVWPGGVPSDGIVKEEVATVFLPVTILYSSLAGIGIICSLICLMYNFFFRKKKVVRITSPNLNYFIIIGVVLLYIDVFFYVMPVTNEALQEARCTITVWLLALGYSFSFGPIITKTFRVWYIFRNTSAKTKTLHDWKLALVVFAFIAVDLVILTVYLAINSTDVIRVPSLEVQGMEINGFPVTFISYVCSSEVRNIVSGILFGYKAIVQIAALVLAFLTRKVKVKGLDDSKFIAVIIYITSITLVMVVICSYTLTMFVNGLAIAVSTGLLVEASCILGLVFIPSMVRYIRDPNGEEVFSRSQHTYDFNESSNEALKNKVQELENKLKRESITNEKAIE